MTIPLTMPLSRPTFVRCPKREPKQNPPKENAVSGAVAVREVLDREFLIIRSRLLDLAAALDRLSRAQGSVDDVPRMAAGRGAVETLCQPGDDRAERMQMCFSLPYREKWREEFGL